MSTWEHSPAPETRFGRLLAYFGLVEESGEEFDDLGSAERLIAVFGWCVLVAAVWSARGSALALLAAASLFPVAVLSITEPRGWRGITARYRWFDGLSMVPIAFFAAAIIFPGATLPTCAVFGVLAGLAAAVVGWRRRRGGTLTPSSAADR